MYNQLTSEQRYVISALLKQEVDKKAIAEEIGVSLSTVYRELKRNKNVKGGYIQSPVGSRDGHGAS